MFPSAPAPSPASGSASPSPRPSPGHRRQTRRRPLASRHRRKSRHRRQACARPPGRQTRANLHGPLRTKRRRDLDRARASAPRSSHRRRCPWPRPLHLVGQGLTIHAAELPALDNVSIASDSLWEPRAKVVAALGAEYARRGEFILPDRLLPLYVRKAEAQEKWEAEHA